MRFVLGETRLWKVVRIPSTEAEVLRRRGVDADSVSLGAVAARARHQESGQQTAALAHGRIGLEMIVLATSK